MSGARDPIEYLLNRLEAARDAKPPTVDYPLLREAVINHVAALREMNRALDVDCRAARLARDAAMVRADAAHKEADLLRTALAMHEARAAR